SGDRAGPDAVGIGPGALADQEGTARPVRDVAQARTAVAIEDAPAGRTGGVGLIAAHTGGVAARRCQTQAVAEAIGAWRGRLLRRVGGAEVHRHDHLDGGRVLHGLTEIQLPVEGPLLEVGEDERRPAPAGGRIAGAIAVGGGGPVAGWETAVGVMIAVQ